ncbi:hypothetical protein BC826DRAFT_363296 [Russula brevipes]|nr:hypothetical protein BC826DRAFT_363296 [Russula brevipes]
MSPATHSPRASRPFDSDFATAATTTFATPYSTVPIALRRYAKKTGKDLMSHPLAIKIDNCESPDSVLLILQEEAQAFGEYRKEDPTLINCLSSVVHGFDTISSSPPFNTSSCIVSPSRFVLFFFYVLQHFSSRNCPLQRQFFLLSLFFSIRPGQRLGRNTMTTLWSSSNVLKTSSHNSGFIPRSRPLLQ